MARPDKDRHPTAAHLADTVFDDMEIQRLMLKPGEACAAAAERVRRLLDMEKVKTNVRALLIWKAAVDTVPKNHIVVLADLDGEQFAIDPTAMQFPGARPAFVPIRDWEAMMNRTLAKQAVVYKDYPSVSEAGRLAGPFYTGHVESFEGGVIMNKPDWYANVRNNPGHFQELLKKMNLEE